MGGDRSRIRWPAWASIVLVLGLTTAASADHPVDDRYELATRFTGSYVNAGGEGEAQDRLDAIEAVVANQRRVLRGVTRRRLLSGTHVTQTYDIRVEGQEVTIAIEDGRSWTTDLEGTKAHYEHDGEPMTMSRVWVNGEIHATGEQKVGTGSYTFRLSEDGRTLTVDFSMDSKWLVEPLNVRTTYLRR